MGESQSFSWTRKEEVEEDREGTRGGERWAPEVVYGGMPDAYRPLRGIPARHPDVPVGVVGELVFCADTS